MSRSVTEPETTREPRGAQIPLELQLERVAAQIRQIGLEYANLLGPARLEQLNQICDSMKRLGQQG